MPHRLSDLASRLWLVLALLTCLGAGAQIRPIITVKPNHVTIRILEAHSGKPVAHEKLGVWLEHGIVLIKSPTDAPAFWTDKQGNATIPLDPRPSINDLSLWVMDDIPCEPFNHIDFKLDYPIEKILAHGVVSDNVCGKARHVPVPGVLIVFVKHHPWWQISALPELSPSAVSAAREP